jgi:hypothetical protein
VVVWDNTKPDSGCKGAVLLLWNLRSPWYLGDQKGTILAAGEVGVGVLFELGFVPNRRFLRAFAGTFSPSCFQSRRTRFTLARCIGARGDPARRVIRGGAVESARPTQQGELDALQKQSKRQEKRCRAIKTGDA